MGIIRGAEEGAAAGNRAAGPVGGAVGGVVGGVEGGIVGGVKGVLGIPQRTGSAGRRDRSDRAELSANQIIDQFAARTARIKADLRLTPEQAKNWPAVESAVRRRRQEECRSSDRPAKRPRAAERPLRRDRANA